MANPLVVLSDPDESPKQGNETFRLPYKTLFACKLGSESSPSMDTFDFLFPQSLSLRARSLSNVSSRPGTPVPSIAPSTPHNRSPNLSPSSSEHVKQPTILEFIPRMVEHLDAQSILTLSLASRQCGHNLRSHHTFRRHHELNGWDTAALERRLEMGKDTKGRPWMFLARSAIHKDNILTYYKSLPTHTEKKSSFSFKDLKDSKTHRSTEKFLRILSDIITEHDQDNIPKLNSLAESMGLSLIQFVAAIPTFDWKASYRKTFVVAAFTNTLSPPLRPKYARDLEGFAATLDFDAPKPSQSLLTTRANFLYTFGCMSYKDVPSKSLSSKDFDPPEIRTSGGWSLPGLRQAVDRFRLRMVLNGFYRKSGGEDLSMRVEIDPVGLASKSRLPFADKNLITVNAIVSHGDGEAPWPMEGTIDKEKGNGELKDRSGSMTYELWVTPWGIVGQKIRGESTHLGYFVLHWA